MITTIKLIHTSITSHGNSVCMCVMRTLNNPIMNGSNNSLFSVPFASVDMAREGSEAREIKMKGRKQRQTIVSGEP